jgi:hypothetical protein
MTMPRLTPAVFPADTRRRVPKVSKNQRVPLWTVEPDGQLFQGVIRVPIELAYAEQHTNAHHKLMALIEKNLQRWVGWRAMRGWFLTNEPQVTGPHEPPEGDRDKAVNHYSRATNVIGQPRDVQPLTEFDYPGEYKWFIAEARFSREDPVYVRLEDMLFLRHLALTYGVDPDRDPLPVSDLPEPENYIEVEGGIDPMQEAEESRQAMGLKRSDYLLGPLEEPL